MLSLSEHRSFCLRPVGLANGPALTTHVPILLSKGPVSFDVSHVLLLLLYAQTHMPSEGQFDGDPMRQRSSSIANASEDWGAVDVNRNGKAATQQFSLGW